MDNTSMVTSIEEQPKYEGVHGWLFFFCLLHVLIGPVLTGYSFLSVWMKHIFGGWRVPGLLTFDIVATILGLGMTVFSIYAGENLWRLNPGAVRVAKNYLLTALGVHIFGLLLPFIVGFPSAWSRALFEDALARLVIGGVIICLWYAYFIKSKRVKTTFGV